MENCVPYVDVDEGEREPGGFEEIRLPALGVSRQFGRRIKDRVRGCEAGP